MSGGSMDYVYSRIEYAAEEVQEEIRRIEENRNGTRFYACNYYRDKYPDNPIFKDANLLKKEVLKRLNDAVKSLKKSAIYARRVEWLTSSDDGYESFVLRLDDELKKLQNTKEEETNG